MSDNSVFNLPHQLKLYIEPIPSLDSLIASAPDDDIALLNEITSNSRKAEILATRQLLRDLFGPDATLCHHPNGSPYLHNNPIHISISHCATHIAIATHPTQRIGIDIETWRPTLERVKEKFLTPDEIATYNTPELLLQAWTAKEAIYKAAGISGLSLLDIKLPINPSAPNNIQRLNTLHHNPQPTTAPAIATISRHNAQFTLHHLQSPHATITIAI